MKAREMMFRAAGLGERARPGGLDWENGRLARSVRGSVDGLCNGRDVRFPSGAVWLVSNGGGSIG